MSLTRLAVPGVDASAATASCNVTTDGPLWTMRLSVMDMRMNAYAFRVLYVFPPRSGHLEQHSKVKPFSTERLAQSFEQLLRGDYPFLIDGEMHVDPDTGCICLRARQHINQEHKKKPLLEVDSVVSSKSTSDVLQTLDFSLAPSRDPQELIAIKCTSLRDGGFVIGLNVKHCVIDADACFAFMNQWGMHYRHVEKARRPAISHDRHLLCEQNGNSEVKFAHSEYTAVDVSSSEPQHKPKPVKPFPKTTQRVFRMSREELKHLKAFVTAGINHAGTVDPGFVSTVDALTALMTVLITQARGHQHDVNVGTAVNGRRRLEPRLPTNYAGNAVFTAFSSFKASELQRALENQQHRLTPSAQILATIALRIRQSIHQQNSAFMRDTIAFLKSLQQHPSKRAEASTKFRFGSDIMFSSWVGLDSLDANFDGARPLCVSSPALPVSDGMVVFQEESGGSDNSEPSAGAGGGVDVLVYLEVDAMVHLERLWSTAAAHCWGHRGRDPDSPSKGQRTRTDPWDGMPPPPPPPPPPLQHPATVSETLQFPTPQESRGHRDRLVSVIREVKTSLSISKAKREQKAAKEDIAAKDAARKREQKTAKEIAPSQNPIAPARTAPNRAPAARPPAALEISVTQFTSDLHGKS